MAITTLNTSDRVSQLQQDWDSVECYRHPTMEVETIHCNSGCDQHFEVYHQGKLIGTCTDEFPALFHTSESATIQVLAEKFLR